MYFGPQPQGGGHLAELEVEVDDAHPLAGVAGEEVGEVGGVEGLAAAAGGGGDREDRARPAGDRGRRRRATAAASGAVTGAAAAASSMPRSIASASSLSSTGSWSRSMAPVGTMSRRLASGRRLKARTRLMAGQLLADQPEPGEARAGAEAGAGDEHVERALGLEHLAARCRRGRSGRPRAAGSSRRRRPAAGRPGARSGRGRGSCGVVIGAP